MKAMSHPPFLPRAAYFGGLWVPEETGAAAKPLQKLDDADRKAFTGCIKQMIEELSA